MRKPNFVSKKEIQAEVAGWFSGTMEYHLRHAKEMVPPPTWRRAGLEKLVDEAMEIVETKISLPDNFKSYAPYCGYSRHCNHWGDSFNRVAIPVFRFYGWMKAAVKFPLVMWLFERGTSGNGMNSPYTVVNPWSIVEQWKSPGALQCFALKAKKRANQILAPYGIRSSRDSLINCFDKNRTVSRRVGKAAKHMAANTIRSYGAGQYLEGNAREVLIKARGLRLIMDQDRSVWKWAADRINAGEFSCFRDALQHVSRLVWDYTDGVRLLTDPTTTESFYGISITKGYSEGNHSKGALKNQWIVKSNQRSFHAEDEYWRSNPKKRAIKDAIGAWKAQKRLEKKNSELLDKLQSADRTVLIYREDSYAAGNCKAGTAAFAEKSGFNGRQLVPAQWLIPHIGNTYVANVLKLVAQQL